MLKIIGLAYIQHPFTLWLGTVIGALSLGTLYSAGRYIGKHAAHGKQKLAPMLSVIILTIMGLGITLSCWIPNLSQAQQQTQVAAALMHNKVQHVKRLGSHGQYYEFEITHQTQITLNETAVHSLQRWLNHRLQQNPKNLQLKNAVKNLNQFCEL